jgi:hypothetical protein
MKQQQGIMERCRGALLAGVLLALLQPVRAAEDPGAPPVGEGPLPETEEQAVEEVMHPFREDEEEQPEEAEPGDEDACDWHLDRGEFQDQSQEVLRSMSCHTFRWFDSWWGRKHDFDEGAVNGMLTLGAEWNQYEGFDPRLRLRVRAPLPNFSRRWDLVLGRVDEEAFISDTQSQDQTFYNPGALERGEEDAWLLGLGHRRGRRQSGWDWSVGVRLRVPPRPYIKAQYLYNKSLGPDTDLRLRQTFFWRSNIGFGTTSRGDLTHGFNPTDVMRWEGIATISEESYGTQWYFGQTWYHLLGGQNAFSVLAFARGETNAPVELHDFGLKMVWRRPWTREWLYLSVGPTITWPRLQPEDERELALGFGLWIEMQFGSWRYR